MGIQLMYDKFFMYLYIVFTFSYIFVFLLCVHNSLFCVYEVVIVYNYVMEAKQSLSI